MKLYLAVTADEYELPLFVADTVSELCIKYHKSYNTVISSISHARGGKGHSHSGYKFIKVIIDDEED